MVLGEHFVDLATSEQIKSFHTLNSPRDISIFFSPKRTLVCERVLEEEGVLGDVKIGDYLVDLIPLDSDLLSFEFPDSFRQLFLVRYERKLIVFVDWL